MKQSVHTKAIKSIKQRKKIQFSFFQFRPDYSKMTQLSQSVI